jgi:hypothetical protein
MLRPLPHCSPQPRKPGRFPSLVVGNGGTAVPIQLRDAFVDVELYRRIAKARL